MDSFGFETLPGFNTTDGNFGSLTELDSVAFPSKRVMLTCGLSSLFFDKKLPVYNWTPGSLDKILIRLPEVSSHKVATLYI